MDYDAELKKLSREGTWKNSEKYVRRLLIFYAQLSEFEADKAENRQRPISDYNDSDLLSLILGEVEKELERLKQEFISSGLKGVLDDRIYDSVKKAALIWYPSSVTMKELEEESRNLQRRQKYESDMKLKKLLRGFIQKVEMDLQDNYVDKVAIASKSRLNSVAALQKQVSINENKDVFADDPVARKLMAEAQTKGAERFFNKQKALLPVRPTERRFPAPTPQRPAKDELNRDVSSVRSSTVSGSTVGGLVETAGDAAASAVKAGTGFFSGLLGRSPRNDDEAPRGTRSSVSMNADAERKQRAVDAEVQQALARQAEATAAVDRLQANKNAIQDQRKSFFTGSMFDTSLGGGKKKRKGSKRSKHRSRSPRSRKTRSRKHKM